MLFSYASQASAEQPHLACFESKQGKNSAAIEREEPFSARNWRGKNKAMDTGVASTSNVNTNFPKTLSQVPVNSKDTL